MISGKILKKPSRGDRAIYKGAIVLSCPDEVCKKIPKLKNYFYIIERRGWRGINDSETADIKLVEDLSTLKETKTRFPDALLLDIGPADFVDTDSFKPIDITKNYEGIQISSWERFKRHELFVQGVLLLPDYKFIKFGHFLNNGNLEEMLLREKVITLSKELNANIDYPYSSLQSNIGLPNSSEEINSYINQSKIGILTTKVEGINRFKMECLSANIPVLVPADTSYPTLKHINEKTGFIFEPTPEGLAKGIKYTIDNYGQYKPREYILKNTGSKNSLNKLKGALETLAKRDRLKINFEGIYWDGRNQSLEWGIKKVELMLLEEINQCKKG